LPPDQGAWQLAKYPNGRRCSTAGSAFAGISCVTAIPASGNTFAVATFSTIPGSLRHKPDFEFDLPNQEAARHDIHKLPRFDGRL